ncbi:MAG: MerR family transcriptional regulator [Candidatus Omnitrophica bacterium]|nr:MerR family transcriptional regulator [Candidatus Omnitrophota bacterium]
MREKNKDNEFEFDIEDFDVEIDPCEPIFPINVVCKLVDMNYWTLHEIIEEGLLKNKKNKGKKLFSFKDVKCLKYIKYLIEDKGVNIKGVKAIFEIKHIYDD